MLGGGFFVGILGFLQEGQNMAPPLDMNFIQHIDFYSKGYSALGTITVVIGGFVIFYFRHRETKRHNREMEKRK